MRASQLLMPISFSSPHDAKAPSHRLMLRVGMIHQLASGIYSYLPLGYKVLEKVTVLVRKAMERTGAQEVSLPLLQPKELWQKSGRWDEYGPDMFRLKDRQGNDFGLSPTHEEPITYLVKETVASYRQLPLILYQIGPKFRDELRPRFGTIRCKEFIMKDAYSFHTDERCAEVTYKKMCEIYCELFNQLGLNFSMVEAQAGIIGGIYSHEFIADSDWGEDIVVYCDRCNYSANLACANCGKHSLSDELPKEIQLKYTPNLTTVQQVSEFLGLPKNKLLKTIICECDGKYVACGILGDSELNENKLKKVLQTDKVRLCDGPTIERLTGGPVGFSGPVGLKVPFIADLSVEGATNLCIGANKANYHYINANPNRDFTVTKYADLKIAQDGDICPQCPNGRLHLKKGIEIGHTFLLGTKYSALLDAYYTTAGGESQLIFMGCYGIGVSRIIAAYIEQHHDKAGIIWQPNIAPFEVIVIIVDVSVSEQVKLAQDIYHALRGESIDVLLDDRDQRAGRKFFDADLIGIPYQVIIGKNSSENSIELCLRKDKKRIYLAFSTLIETLSNYLKEEKLSVPNKGISSCQ